MALEKFKLYYEELPFKISTNIKTAKSGGKAIKKMATKNESKSKTYKKTRTEHIKDVVIAVLVAGIIAFIAGVQFANSQQAEVEQAVSRVETAQTTEPVEVQAKK